MQKISLKILIRRFWKKALPTWILVMGEGLVMMAMPLVIGWAVDDILTDNFRGLVQLGGGGTGKGKQDPCF